MQISRVNIYDTLAMQNCNLVNLPENYNLRYYIYHYTSWPQLLYVSREVTGRRNYNHNSCYNFNNYTSVGNTKIVEDDDNDDKKEKNVINEKNISKTKKKNGKDNEYGDENKAASSFWINSFYNNYCCSTSTCGNSALLSVKSSACDENYSESPLSSFYNYNNYKNFASVAPTFSPPYSSPINQFIGLIPLPSARIAGYVLAKVDDEGESDSNDKGKEKESKMCGHVTSLAVLRIYRNLGIANNLMKLMLLMLQNIYTNAKTCSLHVRKSNMAAIHLYQDKLQFRCANPDIGYYVDGEDAFHMKKYMNIKNKESINIKVDGENNFVLPNNPGAYIDSEFRLIWPSASINKDNNTAKNDDIFKFEDNKDHSSGNNKGGKKNKSKG